MCQAFSGLWRPCLRSGHAPRSKVLLDEFLVNTVGSSRDSSFGKKDMLEWSVGLQPRHISFYKTASVHLSGYKEPSLSRSHGILPPGVLGGWGNRKELCFDPRWWLRDLSKCLSPCVPSQAFQPSACAQLTLSQVDEHLAQIQGTRNPQSKCVTASTQKQKAGGVEGSPTGNSFCAYLVTLMQSLHASLHVVLSPGPFLQRA